MRALVLLIALIVGVPVVTVAQSVARNVNPEAVEFDSPLLSQPGLTGFRVDFFMAYADPTRDTPVKSIDIGLGARDDRGKVLVRLTDVLLDVPNGSYVATIRGTGAGLTPQSEASDAFVLSRPGAPVDRVAEAKRERFWTKVGIAIGGGLLLLPLIF